MGWWVSRMPACSQLLQPCQTICDALDYSLPGSSVRGILQARILEWVACALLQGIFPTQHELVSSALQADSLLLRYWESLTSLLSLFKPLVSSSSFLFFFLIIYLLKKTDHLSCRVSDHTNWILIFASLVVVFNMFLCSLYFKEKKSSRKNNDLM